MTAANINWFDLIWYWISILEFMWQNNCRSLPLNDLSNFFVLVWIIWFVWMTFRWYILGMRSNSINDINKPTPNQNDSDHIRFTKNHQYATTKYSWYIMDLRHVGRRPLRSYLTASMGAAQRGRACTCSERIHHNATLGWRGASHGGHRMDYPCEMRKCYRQLPVMYVMLQSLSLSLILMLFWCCWW